MAAALTPTVMPTHLGGNPLLPGAPQGAGTWSGRAVDALWQPGMVKISLLS